MIRPAPLSWRNRRLRHILALVAIGLWLHAYLPVVSNDRVVGIAATALAIYCFATGLLP